MPLATLTHVRTLYIVLPAERLIMNTDAICYFFIRFVIDFCLFCCIIGTRLCQTLLIIFNSVALSTRRHVGLCQTIVLTTTLVLYSLKYMCIL